MKIDLSVLFDRLLPETLEPLLRPALGNLLLPEGVDGRYALDTVGRLRAALVPEILDRMRTHKQSGALLLTDQEVVRVLFFEEGHVIGATSTVLFERLGRVLLQAGVLDKDDADRLVETEEQQGLAEASALLSEDAARWGLEQRTWEVGCALYFMTQGWWIFVEGTPHLAGTPPVRLDAIQIAMEGLRRYDEWRNGSWSDTKAGLSLDRIVPPAPERLADPAPSTNGHARSPQAEADAIMRMLRDD